MLWIRKKSILSLKTKILFCFMVTSLLLIILTSALNFREEQLLAKADFLKVAQIIVLGILEDIVDEGIEPKHLQKEIIKYKMLKANILNIIVTNNKFIIMGASNYKRIGKVSGIIKNHGYIQNTKHVFKKTLDTKRNYLRVLAPIESISGRLGTLLIDFDTHDNYQKHLLHHAKVTGIMMFIVIFIIGLLYGFINQVILIPIMKMRDGMNKISKGNFEYQIQIDSLDELGTLASDFNKMTQNLGKTTISRDYVDNILKSMTDTLIVLTPDAKLKTVNQATLDLLGYSEDELLGKPVSLIIAEEEEEEEAFSGLRLKKLLKKGSLKNYNMTYRTKTGEKILMSFSGSVMREKKHKELIGIVGVAKDMREYFKLLEESKRLAATEARIKAEKKKVNELEDQKNDLILLSQELDLKNEALKKTQAQLVQAGKLAALGELGAGIAHELNNPLTGILNFCQLAIMQAKKGSPLYEKLKEIEFQTKRMAKIIGNVRDFSTQSKRELALVDISEPLRNGLKLLEGQLKSNNITVQLDISKNLPQVVVDSNQIQQIIINLLLNSRDAIEEKRVKNGETSFLGRIELKVVQNENSLEVKISDNGSGIPTTILDKVYNPFFTTKKIGKGTGLGLSISYGLMKDHLGKMNCESKEGEGTTFRLQFPIASSKKGRLLLDKIKEAA
jgi:PAS domain S-box-containing protein